MARARIALALAAAFLLASCLLSPGRFVSTLDIRKDRSFTFTYVGEVLAPEPETADTKDKSARPKVAFTEDPAEMRAMADALRKEQGYRSVEYVGGRTFRVDYGISGTLERNFVYPTNLDATALIPWVVVEVRKDATVRVKALAFGDMSESGPGGQATGPVKGREGTFTLTTDAALVMHNNEEGPAAGPGSKIVWKVTPTTKAVPTAVIRF